MNQILNQARVTAADSPVLAAFAVGLYVSAFFIAGNHTMLTVPSILLLTVVLTVPVVIAVAILIFVIRVFKQESYAGFLAVFGCGVFMLVTLRGPVFESEVVRVFREPLHGGTWLVAHALYFIFPAALMGAIFRKNVGKLTIILAVMTIAALVLGFSNISLSAPPDLSEQKVANIDLHERPNIYFVLTDGFSSFSYMEEMGIDVSSFKADLTQQEFHLYDDTFANYHATAASMLAMLDMKHHYYDPARKFSEVSKLARQVIGGDNNLVKLLKHNGYRTQYVHQASYLLLQGCTADDCFPPVDPFYGAQHVLHKILPGVLLSGSVWDVGGALDMQSIDLVRNRVVSGIGATDKSSAPLFQYIHLYSPGHADNDAEGTCNEATELQNYKEKVGNVTVDIISIVGDIIHHDPDAVIVISGDHGPFISNQCSREADLQTPGEYRDRMGAITAVRWPAGYDGRYDKDIKTNVNLFRYILASMMTDTEDLLSGRVPDDVYVYGDQHVLKILNDGEFQLPPKELSNAELQDLNDWVLKQRE